MNKIAARLISGVSMLSLPILIIGAATGNDWLFYIGTGILFTTIVLGLVSAVTGCQLLPADSDISGKIEREVNNNENQQD